MTSSLTGAAHHTAPGLERDIASFARHLRAANLSPKAVRTYLEAIGELGRSLRSTERRELAANEPADSTGAIPPKLASVVVAIPAARLSEFATAAMTSTFYLGLETASASVATTP